MFLLVYYSDGSTCQREIQAKVATGKSVIATRAAREHT